MRRCPKLAKMNRGNNIIPTVLIFFEYLGKGISERFQFVGKPDWAVNPRWLQPEVMDTIVWRPNRSTWRCANT